MTRTRIASGALARAVAVVLVALALHTPVAPVASAHCPSGTDSLLLGVISTCQYNDEAEAAIDALNEASDHEIAFVLLKDLRFHPEVVEVRSGGTVVLVYADTDAPQTHDPMSSGSTGSAVGDLAKPAPIPGLEGACFSVSAPSDNGHQMAEAGDNYPVTFRYGGGLLDKSRGFYSGTPIGDATGAQTFKTCPTTTFSIDADGTGILPFHCGVHGRATTAEKGMRAAIRILP